MSSTPGVSTALWRRLDTPGHDAARLAFRQRRWELDGTAVFMHDASACRLDYAIVCDERWRTRSVSTSGWIGEELVDLKLVVDAAGRWSMNGRAVIDCSGCVDVDLAFTPATNLLPIRRLELEVGAEAPVRAAWLRFPELALTVLDQRYRRVDASRYRYESRGGSFVAELVVNDTGFVTSYPGLWELEPR